MIRLDNLLLPDGIASRMLAHNGIAAIWGCKSLLGLHTGRATFTRQYPLWSLRMLPSVNGYG
jgi:hypothetical protein